VIEATALVRLSTILTARAPRGSLYSNSLRTAMHIVEGAE